MNRSKEALLTRPYLCGLSLVLCLVIAPAPSAMAQNGSLIDDIEHRLIRADRGPGGNRAPHFLVDDMYQRKISLDQYRGRAVVLTFLSPQCYKEAIGWLKGVQTNFLGDPSIVFINVLYPGPTPAFSSRNANQRKIRDRVEDFYTEVRERMPPEERRRLESTEIRWIVDWRQDLHRRYDVEANRVHIFLLDQDGRKKDSFSQRTPQTEKLLGDSLEGLRGRRTDD